MDAADANLNLLRFDLDGLDPSLWATRSEAFMSELRRLVAIAGGSGHGPADRQLLNRLPPRGSETAARPVDPAAAPQIEVAEWIIERFREREDAALAAIRENPPSEVAQQSQRSLPIQRILRDRQAFLAGDGRDRDLMIGGGRSNEG